MIKSMTGFGKADLVTDEYVIKVELRALNSKFLDLNLKLSSVLREKEYAFRTILNDKIQRGKADVNINIELAAGAGNYQINKALVKNYYNDIKSIATELGEPNYNPLDAILKMPDVLSASEKNNVEQLAENTITVLEKAIAAFDQFRAQEGKLTQQEFETLIQNIKNSLSESIRLEPERMNNVREKIGNALNELGLKEKIDANRFEQELIYYLERMDFTEERVRLLNHCDYFIKTMKEDQSNGRKLNFIAQEIGREINTLGSKANHAGIQQQVVMMKDELEKIKEQLMNVL